MVAIRLIYPLESGGRTFTTVNVKRPNPIAFARYWLHRDQLPYPIGVIDVPVEVADALNKIDLDRVMAAAASVCRPYLFLIAIWQVFRPPSPELSSKR